MALRDITQNKAYQERNGTAPAPAEPTVVNNAPAPVQPTRPTNRITGQPAGGVQTPTEPIQQPVNTPTTPTQATKPPSTEIKDAQGNVIRPELLAGEAYQDDSDVRQQQIINNLNQARQQNPASLTDANTFRQYYNYSGRNEQQKQTLDNWYNGYSEGRTLAQQTARTLSDQLKAGTVSQAQLANLQVYDPDKYANTMKLYEQGAILSGYNNQLNPQAQANPFQGIIDNITQNLSNFSQTPKIYDQYKEQINSPEMKELMGNINTQQTKIEEMDLDILNAQKTIEKKYEGSGITRGKLNAIINDETFELSNARSNLAIQMNSAVNKYNSQMSTISKDLELQLQDYQLQQQAQTMQMQQIGMLTNLMSYETPQQQSDRAFADLIRQQEYLEGNIYSNDPATRKKAVSNAVDNILKEFAGIPMVRSREQMIQDIQTMVDNGTDLGTALTKNLREPIMQKPEYKKYLQQKFPPQTVSIGGINYTQSANGDLTPVKINKPRTGGQINLDETVINTGIKNVYGSDVKLKPTVASMITQAQTALSQQGITLKIADSHRSSETQKNAYESGKPGVAPAGKSRHEKGQAIDLSQTGSDNMNNEKVFNALRAAGLQQHPGEWRHWSYGEFGGATGNASGGVSGSYKPELASFYERLTGKGKSPTNDEMKNVMNDYGFTTQDLYKQAEQYKTVKDQELLPLVSNTLSDIDKLLKMDLDYVDWTNMQRNTIGTKGREVNNLVNKIISSAALNNLIELKNNGATFGALSDNELSFITNASINLDKGTKLATFKKNLKQYKDILTKGVSSVGAGTTTQNTQTNMNLIQSQYGLNSNMSVIPNTGFSKYLTSY